MLRKPGTVTITSKNMIVVPKKAREKLKLHEGQKLRFFVSKEEITLVPERSINELAGVLKGPRSSAELIAESRKNVSRYG